MIALLTATGNDPIRSPYTVKVAAPIRETMRSFTTDVMASEHGDPA